MSLIQINDLLSEKKELQEEINKQNGIAIGIDLGTSNSVVSYHDGQEIKVIENDFGRLIPSVVLFSKQGNLVGNAALLKEKESLVFKSIKRLMGKSSADVALENSVYEYDKQQKSISFKLENDQNISPEEISAEILKYIKDLAEKKIGSTIEKAVITVPAYFDENQRLATKNAASLAGLEVLRLINEPTAAALAYGLDKNDDVNLQGIYLVYDLGGGTFDISILNLQKGVFKVLSTLGDTFLGGDDIDEIILQEILKKANFKRVDISPIEISNLLSIAKKIKEELSFANQINKEINLKDKFFTFSITKEFFEESIKDIIEKTLKFCSQAILDANIELSEIKGIILVGGSTRIPYLQRKIEDSFGIKPLCSINPDEVVSMGAAYKAGELSGKIQNSLLLDVIPLSIGVEMAGGIVEKIIYRNTIIPIIKKQQFTTFKDNQTAMTIHILQGERELVQDLRSLGKFSLKGIPPMPAGVARVVVSFSIDADGLLIVEAQEESTKIKQSVEIKPSWGLNFEEMRKIIEDSMENAEEDMKNRLLSQAKIEAQRVIDALVGAIKQDRDLLDDKYYNEIQEQLDFLIQSTQGEDRQRIDENVVKLDSLTMQFAENRMNKKINKMLSGKSVKEIEEDLI